MALLPVNGLTVFLEKSTAVLLIFRVAYFPITPLAFSFLNVAIKKKKLFTRLST